MTSPQRNVIAAARAVIREFSPIPGKLWVYEDFDRAMERLKDSLRELDRDNRIPETSPSQRTEGDRGAAV